MISKVETVAASNRNKMPGPVRITVKSTLPEFRDMAETAHTSVETDLTWDDFFRLRGIQNFDRAAHVITSSKKNIANGNDRIQATSALFNRNFFKVMIVRRDQGRRGRRGRSDGNPIMRVINNGRRGAANVRGQINSSNRSAPPPPPAPAIPVPIPTTTTTQPNVFLPGASRGGGISGRGSSISRRGGARSGSGRSPAAATAAPRVPMPSTTAAARVSILSSTPMRAPPIIPILTNATIAAARSTAILHLDLDESPIIRPMASASSAVETNRPVIRVNSNVLSTPTIELGLLNGNGAGPSGFHTNNNVQWRNNNRNYSASIADSEISQESQDANVASSTRKERFMQMTGQMSTSDFDSFHEELRLLRQNYESNWRWTRKTPRIASFLNLALFD